MGAAAKTECWRPYVPQAHGLVLLANYPEVAAFLAAVHLARVVNPQAPSNTPLQSDVVLAYARNHAAERQRR